MRHTRIALLFTLGYVASASWLACSTSTPSSSEETPDGGGAGGAATVTAPDGSMADGSISVPGLDAGPDVESDAAPDALPDAGPDAADASEEPAPPAPVQVVVINGAGPEEGVVIVLGDSTGMVLTTATTDAGGRVVQELAAGSQVTALLGTIDAPSLVTVTGVKPGDILTLIDGPLAVSGATAQVTFGPLDQGDASVSVSDYWLNSGGCGNDTGGVAETLDYGLGSGCDSTGQFPVLVQAQGSSGEWVAWQSGKGTLATADAGVASVDLTKASWSTTFGTQSVTLLNAPDSLEPGVGFTEFTSTDAVSNVAFGLSQFTAQYPDAGVQEFSFSAAHPGLADFDQVEADNYVSQNLGSSILAIADRVTAMTLASPSASDTIDLNDALPAITNATLDAKNPSQPSIGWTSAGPLSSAVATVVQAQWTDVNDAGTQRTGNWTIIVPASQMSVVPPQIPATSGLGPSATATWSQAYPMVYTMNGDAFPSYDAIRATAALVGPALNVGSSPLLIPALPANGRARMSAYYPN